MSVTVGVCDGDRGSEDVDGTACLPEQPVTQTATRAAATNGVAKRLWDSRTHDLDTWRDRPRVVRRYGFGPGLPQLGLVRRNVLVTPAATVVTSTHPIAMNPVDTHLSAPAMCHRPLLPKSAMGTSRSTV
ncbi:hypothetical protein SaccyDRAFT_5094 [Saccharomonospora cyanea NA-134]|uniref:Uncharacterized protein n=1 Tax=Saccharomonospora cyanea NA-134 TaxID=882082 RepID=H5XQF5_9PSEU|nr:hypothetical protein SaccyDRAFT_5094 [Saccharomonospora cyanea NA-134]